MRDRGLKRELGGLNMVAWWWVPITAIVTLLVFGMLKSGSDADEWHNGFMAGMIWKGYEK